jgi:hypothetical protein
MLKKKIYFYQCFLCRPRNQIINQEAIQNQDQQAKMAEKTIIEMIFQFSMNMFTKVS